MKNIDTLIKALEKIKFYKRKVYLVIVGSGPEKENLISLTASLNLSKQVYFMGYRTDIAPIISAVDIGCLVSDYESFGIPIIEFLSMEKQVITTNTGIAQEVSKYVKIVNRQNLVNNVVKAVTELNKKSKPKINRSRILEKYSVASYFQQLEHFYLSLNIKK